MTRRRDRRHWRRRQGDDPYLARARAEGWRSRSVYKLIEIQRRERLLRPGATVIDLGAAPGGWSQYAASLVGDQGRVLAVDLLPIDDLPGVHCIQGDFGDESVLEAVENWLGDRPADLVMSDMAPNISGLRAVDQPRAMLLAELAAELALKTLRPGGAFVCKLFHGEGFDEYLRALRPEFERLRVRKPAASRPESRETYLVATARKL